MITSAGLILAGTFCTLLATELESLFQVGFTVALGLLVDTFLIRIFLVPSIALLLGSKAHMSENAPRAAVVGAGPSGFYATDQLLKAGFEVDLLEVLPTPFGLVRAGVAPDHPKIKSVTRVYEKTAKHPGFRFFGGVELGGHISRQDLLDRYHVVLYAVGTARRQPPRHPRRGPPRLHGALEFVAWYNGHPDYADHEFDLSATRAVVIGNGNVAVDVARMLVLDPDEVAATDTADHADRAARRRLRSTR